MDPDERDRDECEWGPCAGRSEAGERVDPYPIVVVLHLAGLLGDECCVVELAGTRWRRSTFANGTAPTRERYPAYCPGSPAVVGTT